MPELMMKRPKAALKCNSSTFFFFFFLAHIKQNFEKSHRPSSELALSHSADVCREEFMEMR